MIFKDMKVTLLEAMGNDLSVVNAARVSFEKESEWETELTEKNTVSFVLSLKDKNLIKYLAKNGHWTPFGHCFATFRIKAPIFVARQLVKHQVGLVWNEVSRRYVDSEPEFYMPSEWRARAENVKQGSSDKAIDPNQQDFNIDILTRCSMKVSLDCYASLLSSGVCPEQARMILPLNTMTEWVWSGSLMAFARVCKLRLDPHTQKETSEIARQISNNMVDLFPVSWEALMED